MKKEDSNWASPNSQTHVLSKTLHQLSSRKWNGKYLRKPSDSSSYAAQGDCAQLIFVHAVCAQNFRKVRSLHGWLRAPSRGLGGGAGEVKRKGRDLTGTVLGREIPWPLKVIVMNVGPLCSSVVRFQFLCVSYLQVCAAWLRLALARTQCTVKMWAPLLKR